ncbi:TRAP transporter small permease subunit [Noviherbaspirillum sp.]|uniref:TRAP transporter small permease subunit n=1 Tax=Noviherbaspirillum sp. TaxID=1926288 RepID=UPI002FE003AF
MKPLLKLSNIIDVVNNRIGQGLMWLILAAVLISAGNAFVRKIFGVSSNAYLEVQWYLFAAVFMLGAGYTFLKNAHVRIDFVSSRLSARTRSWIDIVGIIAFLLPLCWLLITLSWPLFVNAWESGEVSGNAGGLVRWPVYLLIPVGMALLLAQGLSELIKRFAFLSGLIPDPLAESDNPEEDELKRLEEEAAARASQQAGGKI